MPPKKKSTSSKKKAKQKGVPKKDPAASSSPAADATVSRTGDVVPTSKFDVTSAKPVISIECAEAFAAYFSADYPPMIDIDEYEDNHLSKKERMVASQAYSECSANFNRGNDHLNSKESLSNPSQTNNHWYLAQTHFLDALQSAMKCPGVFLKTTGMDHRNLLCKVTLCLAQCRGNLLDAKGMTAWGKVAVQADPTYYNGYAKYAFGLLHQHLYKEALSNFKKAQTMEGLDMASPAAEKALTDRIAELEKIVNAEPKSKEQKAALLDVAEKRRGSAVQCYHACNMQRPKKSCTMCFWPAAEQNLRCSKCFTVYYCHRNCQVAHYNEHKPNCVETKEGVADLVYPTPDYPRSEWIEDEHYDMFLQNAKSMGCDMIQCAANNCSLETLKRALMVEKDAVKNINGIWRHEYPIHRAALRNEPNSALDICKILIKHGACPNVYRGDGVHLLDICRGQAKWVDDPDPSFMCLMYRMPLQMNPAMLQKMERRESEKLVEFITEAIQNHVMCKHCKRQKATRIKMNHHED